MPNAIHYPHLPVLSRDVKDIIDTQNKGIVVLHLDWRRILEPWVRRVLELILHLVTSIINWRLKQHAGIFDFSFKYPSLLLLDPHFMLEAPLLFELLLFEFTPDLLDPLLLKHLFHFCSHGTHLSVLIHLVLVQVRVRRKSRQNAERVIFLSCQIHEGTLLHLEVLTSHFVLPEDEFVIKVVARRLPRIAVRISSTSSLDLRHHQLGLKFLEFPACLLNDLVQLPRVTSNAIEVL